MFLDGIMIELHTFESSNSEIQGFRCLGCEQYSCLPIDDRLGGSSFSIGNDGGPDSHGFYGNESEVFLRSEKKCSGITEKSVLLGI